MKAAVSSGLAFRLPGVSVVGKDSERVHFSGVGQSELP